MSTPTSPLVQVVQELEYIIDAFEIAGNYSISESLYEILADVKFLIKDLYNEELYEEAMDDLNLVITKLAEFSMALGILGNHIAEDRIMLVTAKLESSLDSFKDDKVNLGEYSKEVVTNFLNKMMEKK